MELGEARGEVLDWRAEPSFTDSTPTAMSETPVTLSRVQAGLVRGQLSRILESEFFRGSHRCCRFLEYSVEHVLQGSPPGELKERSIGIEVFHRPATYDTAQDNIVRVTANEVRKRLAQYYSQVGQNEELTIVLPSGSYGVNFQWREAPPAAIAAERSLPAEEEPQRMTSGAEQKKDRRALRNGMWIALAAALLLLTSGALYHYATRNDVVGDVWSPVLETKKTALICIAQPLAFGQSSQTTFFPMPNAFVGVGDAYALADISRLLSTRGKAWRLLAGNETPSQDLKSGPVILIGAFSNPWTLKVTENLRFAFAPDPGTAIIDRSKSGKEWHLDHLTPEGETPEDYAIVSRFLSPETGEPVIVLAGISNYGTQAAAEFFASEDLLANALKDAPKGWKSKNFQIVLHTKVIGKTPERPTVVAEYFW